MAKKSKKSADLDVVGLELGNKPPQAVEFEEAVLGSMLIDPNCIDEVLDELKPDCFYVPKNRLIFEAIVALVAEYEPIELRTVVHKLSSQSALEEIGGAGYIASLTQNVGVSANVEYYIKVLKQKRIQRDLIEASLDILKSAYDETINVDMLMDNAQTQIYNAIQDGVKKEILDIGSVIKSVNDELEQNENRQGYSGVPSGYTSLDDMTMGWQKSDLIIIAARPSVGKTAFALNIARNAAVQYNVPVAFFSIEMPATQLAKRLIIAETEIASEKLKGGKQLTKEDWEIMNTRLQALAKAPMYIDDTPSLPVMEFRSKVKRLVKSKGVGLVVVDYLQLLQGPSDSRSLREQEVAAISRTLKATAKEMNIPIIALSQLSRNAVQRTGGNGRPQLSDIRESGAIEQDADMVLFVHRPDYVGMSENKEDHEKTFIIIAKHRNGEVGEIPMRFKHQIVRFVEDMDSLDNFASYSSSNNNISTSNTTTNSYDPFDGDGFE